MRNLQGFSDAATPVFYDLDRATPALTEATRNLAPFTAASTVALKSLGNAGEGFGAQIPRRRPDRQEGPQPGPHRRQPDHEARRIPRQHQEDRAAWNSLLDLIYNGTAATNEFDEYGHMLRSLVTLTELHRIPRSPPKSGCKATFSNEGKPQRVRHQGHATSGSRRTWPRKAAAPRRPNVGPSTYLDPSAPAEPTPELGEGEKLGLELSAKPKNGTGRPNAESGEAARGAAAPQRALLDYLLGP